MISRKCLGFDDYYNQQAEETVGKYKQGRSFRAEYRTDPPIQADNSQGGQEDQECRRIRAADGFPGRRRQQPQEQRRNKHIKEQAFQYFFQKKRFSAGRVHLLYSLIGVGACFLRNADVKKYSMLYTAQGRFKKRAE